MKDRQEAGFEEGERTEDGGNNQSGQPTENEGNHQENGQTGQQDSGNGQSSGNSGFGDLKRSGRYICATTDASDKFMQEFSDTVAQKYDAVIQKYGISSSGYAVSMGNLNSNVLRLTEGQIEGEDLTGSRFYYGLMYWMEYYGRELYKRTSSNSHGDYTYEPLKERQEYAEMLEKNYQKAVDEINERYAESFNALYSEYQEIEEKHYDGYDHTECDYVGEEEGVHWQSAGYLDENFWEFAGFDCAGCRNMDFKYKHSYLELAEEYFLSLDAAELSYWNQLVHNNDIYWSKYITETLKEYYNKMTYFMSYIEDEELLNYYSEILADDIYYYSKNIPYWEYNLIAGDPTDESVKKPLQLIQSLLGKGYIYEEIVREHIEYEYDTIGIRHYDNTEQIEWQAERDLTFGKQYFELYEGGFRFGNTGIITGKKYMFDSRTCSISVTNEYDTDVMVPKEDIEKGLATPEQMAKEEFWGNTPYFIRKFVKDKSGIIGEITGSMMEEQAKAKETLKQETTDTGTFVRGAVKSVAKSIIASKLPVTGSYNSEKTYHNVYDRNGNLLTRGSVTTRSVNGKTSISLPFDQSIPIGAGYTEKKIRAGVHTKVEKQYSGSFMNITVKQVVKQR